MNNVIPFQARGPKCGRCGGPGKEVDLEFDGELLDVLVSCDACTERTKNELERVRPIFETMLACGVPDDLANDVMTYLLGRLYP